ncbi:MAG: ABC transporter substrate-binding protein [Christensenellales bacterium]|jgi:iron complex transport system substrate-binding protein
MRRIIGIMLCIMLTLSALPGTAESARVFVDSAGRSVELPETIERVAVSGPLAQHYVFAICPDKLVGIAVPWEASAANYFDDAYLALPVLGQVYGGRTMNMETLIENGAQLVIDIGEPKDTIAQDLDDLQAQTGIPFVHISAYMPATGDAFVALGELLALPEEAARLAAYADDVYERCAEIAARVPKAEVVYLTGEDGLGVIARGSYHGEVIDLMANNIAVLPEVSSRGSGNAIDLEQLMVWNPPMILFAPESIARDVGAREIWKDIDAIARGAYYESPAEPFNWMGFPPASQRCLGMLWLTKLLYPEEAQYDLYAEAAEYFRLFCHFELTEEQYHAIMAHSLPD